MNNQILIFFFCFLCFGCNRPEPIWELSVLNVKDVPIQLKTQSGETIRIFPDLSVERIAVKSQEIIQILQEDELVESYRVGDDTLNFKSDEDGRVLLVVGEPRALAVADYTEFYDAKDAKDKREFRIKVLADLRDKNSVLLERGDDILWPRQGLLFDKYKVLGFSERRFLRIARIPESTKKENVAAFLQKEFDSLVEENPWLLKP